MIYTCLRFMIALASCFTIGKVPGCIQNLQSLTQLPPHARPLILGMPQLLGFTLHKTNSTSDMPEPQDQFGNVRSTKSKTLKYNQRKM
jgi:hypothetical protein